MATVGCGACAALTTDRGKNDSFSGARGDRARHLAIGRDDPDRAATDQDTAIPVLARAAAPIIASTTSRRARSPGWRSCTSRRSRSGRRRSWRAGRDADLIGDLSALVAQYPLRERLRGQLMVALYRPGGRRTRWRRCARAAGC